MQPMDKVMPPSALLGCVKLHLLWFVSEGDDDVLDQCDLATSALICVRGRGRCCRSVRLGVVTGGEVVCDEGL